MSTVSTTRQGVVTVKEIGTTNIHSYTSPQDGLFVNTHIIEDADSLVVIDGQFFLDYAREVADYIDELGKPVERFVFCTSHPDHWFGFEILKPRFPHVPVYALQSVIDYIRDGTVKPSSPAARASPATRSPPTVIVPDQALPEGRQEIVGRPGRSRRSAKPESLAQAVIRFQLETIAVFDLVFPNLYHLFTVAPYFEHGRRRFAGFRQEQGYKRLLVGHGETTDPSTIDGNIAYLEEAQRIHGDSQSNEEFATKLKERFPERQEPWLDRLLGAAALRDRQPVGDSRTQELGPSILRVVDQPAAALASGLTIWR